MKANTRFNPTVNGPLHIGHLYNILINQGEAKRSGGKFGVRFDDTQRIWTWLVGEKAVEVFIADMQDDLAWLGIQPDYCSRQSALMSRVDALLEHEFHYFPKPQPFSHCQGAEAIGVGHHLYPYTERLTAEKVVMDFIEDGAEAWLIRGMDMLTEDCLYRYFCERFELPIPRMTYIPRLQFERDEISKTFGKFKIGDFRYVGMDPNRLMAMLEHDCLSLPGWQVDHIRPNPTLGSWAEEVLDGLPI